jgi:hypothetical protein
MAGHGDDIGHGELRDHRSPAQRLREGPVLFDRPVVVVLQRATAEPDPPAGPTLVGHLARRPGTGGGMPAAQPVRDVHLVRSGPLGHRRGHQQVAQPTVERHRRQHGGAGLAGCFADIGGVGEHRGVGLDLGRDVDVRDPGAQGGRDHGTLGHRERTGAVDHRRRAGEGLVQGRGVVHGGRPDLQPSGRRAELLGQHLQRGGVTPGEDRSEAAPEQFGHDEAPGVPGRPVHHDQIRSTHDSP